MFAPPRSGGEQPKRGELPPIPEGGGGEQLPPCSPPLRGGAQMANGGEWGGADFGEYGGEHDLGGGEQLLKIRDFK